MSATGHTHRLFVAYDLPDIARAHLARLATAVVERAGGRAVPPENLHVTAHFIGAVPEQRLAEVAAAAFDVMGGDVLTTAVGRLHCRPRPSAARLVAAELADPTGALAAHAARLAGALGDARDALGAARPFWPHVTLVRMSRPTQVRRFPRSESEHVFAIHRITLYDSHMSPGMPPRYEALMTVPLGQHRERMYSHG